MRKRMFFILVILLMLMLNQSCEQSNFPLHLEIPYIETGVDYNEWALIPAGEFYSGQQNNLGKIDYDYEIMITDVTNEQYAKYLNEALKKGTVKIENNKVMGYYPGERFDGHKHEQQIKAGYWIYVPLDEPGVRLKFNGEGFTVDKGFENHPVTMITWFGANAYCEFYGWDLPSEMEWEKAARGTDTRAYPWGDEINEHLANYNRSNKLIRKLFGLDSGITTPVGFFNGREYKGFQTKNAQSPYGLYDMAGNVWQWTRDDYPDMSDRFMRGGSWANYDYNLRIWARNSSRPDYYAINVGFRCVRKASQKNEAN